eukprot:6159196-Ditylum_brightwellii.AAC.1
MVADMCTIWYICGALGNGIPCMPFMFGEYHIGGMTGGGALCAANGGSALVGIWGIYREYVELVVVVVVGLALGW